MNDPLSELDAIESCGCWVCLDRMGQTATFYVLCPECGCKRCPKATNHAHTCTGSNASGQVGSDYGSNCPGDCCTEYVENKRRRSAEFDSMFGEELAEIRAERLAKFRAKHNLKPST